MSYIYALAGDEHDHELALVEAEALTGGRACSGRFVAADRRVAISRSGYLAAGIDLLAHGRNAAEVRDQLRVLGVASEDFAIAVRKFPRALPVSHRAVATELGLGIEGYPDLEHPRERFLALVDAEGLWFGRELPAGEPEWRAFDHKPHPFSSALGAQTARAVANLFVRGGEAVVDPCCGSGSLLIHAAALGARVFGSDINPKMVGSTRKNLEHFGFSGTITQQDAAEARGQYDILLTNVPYDRMSAIAERELAALVSNVVSLAPRGAVVAAHDLTGAIEKGGATVERVIRKSKFSMTRQIFLYRRDG